MGGGVQRKRNRFQSTLPTRGSDVVEYVVGRPIKGFNPRSPRGGATISPPAASITRWCFNPRSPRGGATWDACHPLAGVDCFNPRSPRGGATRASGTPFALATSFNPRSPRGGATAEKCICMQHFREFTEYYPLRHGDACCIAPQDCIIQAFFGAKKRCFYVRLCFALKNKGVRG